MSSPPALSKFPLNRTLEKIRLGEVVYAYVAGNFAGARHIDLVCRSGYFGAIWFDLEHFDIPTGELAVLSLLTRAHPVSPIARIKASDYQSVMRALETGVDGLICAMVEDAAEAARIVKWAKFNNPQPTNGEVTGSRGWNGGNIDSSYAGTSALDYMRYQNTETFVLCQIEHEEALSRAKEIAAVPGVDGLFFGPGDYSVSVGLPAQIAHPQVMAAMGVVAEAAKASGKWWGTVAVGAEMIEQAKALGAQFICPGGDLKVMKLGLRELAKSFAPELA